MPAKLLKCPFCGFDVESEESYKDPINVDSGMYEGETIYVIACPDCGAGVAPGHTLEEAVRNWNRRAEIKEEKILQSASPTNSESKSAAQIFSDMDKHVSDLESFVSRYSSLHSVRG